MKNFGKKNIIFRRLLTFVIAAFMWSSAISMVSVTTVVSVPPGTPLVVDGIISSGEYDDALYIPLTGPWPPSAPFPPSLVDCYVYWDTQYLWIAVDEPVPNWGTPGSFIEFMWDAGPSGTLPYYHAWVLFSDMHWQYVRCPKPSGSWGWATDPFPGTSWWATDTATEFKIDYTLYGTSYGDAIKIVIDTADNSVPPPPFGDCQVWPANPTYYPSETPSTVATWGTIVLGGGGQPPTADAGGSYSGLVGESIVLDGTGSSDLGGTIVSYEWDLDDDGFYDDATGPTTTHSWSSEGSYTISLKVTDNDGLSDTDDATVNIGDHAVDGVISPGEYDGGMAVMLIKDSFSVDAYIDWDSQYLYVAVDEPNPSYIEFAFDAGPHRSYYDVFTLFSHGGTNHQTSPKPPGSGWSSVSYGFTALSGTATEFKVDYTDFGIALGDTIKMCIERGAGSPNAYWPEDGIIWDNSYRGPDPSTWGDVTLTAPPEIPPVADVNGPYEDTDCDEDYTIDFDGSGSDDSDGTIVTYDWDFGDGTGWHNDMGATPPYTYSNFGEYTVTLRVTDSDGLTDTDTSTAKVYGVVANANGPYEDDNCDYTINFDGSGSTGYQTPLTYDWDFGDGTGWHNDIGATPPYTYPNYGEYTVTLRVTESGNGCSDTDTTTVTVDCTPPTTTKTYGTPYYTDGVDEWITSVTPITLTADDGTDGSGVQEIHYNYGDGWNVAPGDTTTFTIPDECTHTIEYYSVDNLGNTETTKSQTVKVDNTPPTTTCMVISYLQPKGPYRIEPLPSNTIKKIYLRATDLGECAVGQYYIHYRTEDKGGWSAWQIGGLNSPVILKLSATCIEYYAEDILGNTEPTHHEDLDGSGGFPPFLFCFRRVFFLRCIPLFHVLIR